MFDSLGRTIRSSSPSQRNRTSALAADGICSTASVLILKLPAVWDRSVHELFDVAPQVLGIIDQKVDGVDIETDLSGDIDIFDFDVEAVAAQNISDIYEVVEHLTVRKLESRLRLNGFEAQPCLLGYQ